MRFVLFILNNTRLIYENKVAKVIKKRLKQEFFAFYFYLLDKNLSSTH